MFTKKGQMKWKIFLRGRDGYGSWKIMFSPCQINVALRIYGEPRGIEKPAEGRHQSQHIENVS